MTEKNESTQSLNALKSEHLNEGVSPIMICLGTCEDFNTFVNGDYFSAKSENIDWFGSPSDLKRQNIKNAGLGTYVVSPVDAVNKRSKDFLNCTGIVVAGQKKDKGGDISVLSHKKADRFLPAEVCEQFAADLKERLEELKANTIPGTVDGVIYGGNYIKNSKYGEEFDKLAQQDYKDSITLYSRIFSEVFGFEPVVGFGPKLISHGDSVFFDNAHRRLHVFRPAVGDASSESFLPKDIEKQEEKWQDWSHDYPYKDVHEK